MQAEEIIQKKKNGKELEPLELKSLLGGWLQGRISDGEMKQFIRAVKGRGLTFGEMLGLMHLLSISDVLMDLSPLAEPTVDFHSVGGVGERVSLQVHAIAAAIGFPVAQLSGPGTGYTVSPWDKAMSVPGFQGELDYQTFMAKVNALGYGLQNTSERIAPAAKRFFALCQEVGADGPVPFFVAAEMSRILAAGADVILLEVAFGEDCIVGTLHEAVLLARTMCALGETVGKRVGAVVTHCQSLPGCCLGSVEEFAEAVECLDSEGDPSLLELSKAIATRLVYLGGRGPMKDCEMRVNRVVNNHAASEMLLVMAEEQGGDPDCLSDLNLLPKPKYQHSVRARKDGWISGIDHELLAAAGYELKATRLEPGEAVDPAAGIVLKKYYGTCVVKGEEIAVLGAEERGHFGAAADLVRRAIRITRQKPGPQQYLYAWVDGKEVETLPPPASPVPKGPKDNVIRNLFPRGDK